jgi:hypothetical protein
MRARTVAILIVVFAGVDLLALVALPLFGIIESPLVAAGSWAQAMLALAFVLAAVSLVGTLSILLTGRFEARPELLGFEIHCRECGVTPRLDLAFCHGCGAGV